MPHVLGGDGVEVGAGEALYIPPHSAHAVHASGSDDFRYVYGCTDTVMPGHPPDPAFNVATRAVQIDMVTALKR